MTQKDHFNALAAAVVAAYQKESAAPAALVEKYSAMLDQAKATQKPRALRGTPQKKQHAKSAPPY